MAHKAWNFNNIGYIPVEFVLMVFSYWGPRITLDLYPKYSSSDIDMYLGVTSLLGGVSRPRREREVDYHNNNSILHTYMVKTNISQLVHAVTKPLANIVCISHFYVCTQIDLTITPSIELHNLSSGLVGSIAGGLLLDKVGSSLTNSFR